MTDLIYPTTPAPLLPGSGRGDVLEMLPIVDLQGNVSAQAVRSFCHAGTKPLHPVVHLHILNRNGELYLQHRSASKDLFPLRWDTAVGGHISYGEYVIEALFREAGEELGFFDFNPVWLDTYEFESQRERELINVFAAVGNFNLKPDGEEVLEGRIWSEEEIAANLGMEVFTPNFESEYLRIKQSLQSLL